MDGIAILFISFAILLLLSVPIAFALGISSLLTIFVTESIPLNFLAQGMFTTVDSYALMAVPLFVFSGAIMEFGGLSRRLIEAANSFVGHLTGGLATVALLAAAVFAMLSGSGPATVAAIGGIMIPAMIRGNYSKSFSAAVTATAGGVGIVLPPSIPLIIYGITTNTSIAQLFLAGFVPGLAAVAVLWAVAYRFARKNNYRDSEQRVTWRERGASINRAKWVLLMPVIVLGGIYGGVFTPTEAAAVAVAYSTLLALFYREIKLPMIPALFKQTTLISGIILIIIATASTYGRVLTLEQVPATIASFLNGLPVPFWVILVVIIVLLLFIGTFMETLAGIILLAPILVPIVTELGGMDPVHFGIIMIMASMVGFTTPPVGDNLNVASAISGLSIERVSVAALPFVGAMILLLLVVAFVPEIAMFLPNLFSGGAG